ncbi:MAG TPA: Clp protease N-terminal domain-containing protein [Streptosporangiaceae bacterium]|nr:Clp protease N-terminal domain-containing protein [Streptosporangiaceae bacterium]
MLSQEEAARLQHGRIGPEHVLLALLRLQGGAAFAVLTGDGIDYDRVLAAVTERAEPTGAPEGAPAGAAGALAAIGFDLGQVVRVAEENFGPGALRSPLRGPARSRPVRSKPSASRSTGTGRPTGSRPKLSWPAWAAATRWPSRTFAKASGCWTWVRAPGSMCCCRPAGSARPGSPLAST